MSLGGCHGWKKHFSSTEAFFCDENPIDLKGIFDQPENGWNVFEAEQGWSYKLPKWITLLELDMKLSSLLKRVHLGNN